MCSASGPAPVATARACLCRPESVVAERPEERWRSTAPSGRTPSPRTSTGWARSTAPASKSSGPSARATMSSCWTTPPTGWTGTFEVCGLTVPADAPSILDRPRRQPQVADHAARRWARWRSGATACCNWTGNGPRTATRPGSAGCSAPTGSPACTISDAARPSPWKLDRIRRHCDAHAIEFLAVDSVGLACDGKLSDDDTAIRFHRALGTLPPALCAAHVPKSSLEPGGQGRRHRPVRQRVLLEPVSHVLAGEETARRHR